MAIRQYIGARYVPRFLGTYDATQIYDALDVVDNGSGTSYIARKTVPAGTPLTDTSYWFVYGASSGAIIQLQNDMIQAQNDIISIDKKISRKIVMISDSYGVEGSPFVAHSFYYYLNQMLANSNYDVTLYTSALRGAAFARTGDSSYWYITELQALESSIPDKTEITDVMIVGGYNDLLTYPMNGLVTSAETLTEMANFRAYVNANYPLAKLHFIPVGSNVTTGSSQYFANMNIRLGWFIKNLHDNGYAVHENAPYVIATKYYHDTDLAHPSLEGQQEIAGLLFNYITTGNTDITRTKYFSESDVTVASGITLTNLNMNVLQNNGIKELSISRVNFSCASTTVGGGVWLPICTLPNDCIVDDTTRTQLYIKASSITYNPVLRINDRVLEFGALSSTATTGMDLRGNLLVANAMEI